MLIRLIMKNKKNNMQKMKKADLIKKDVDQSLIIFIVYGKVIVSLGDCRLKVLCEDGKSRVCTIRGKLRKTVWIREGDIILVSLREYDDFKGDVLCRYTLDQINSLIASGDLKSIDIIDDVNKLN
ncbi:Translation elongation initiation factor 4C (nucleomorph) [Bigelowiella natans]|uniref:Translation elongation initiation factor 4C n=1 Tax=Bigelowiella natans TaxID=227086 RepID=Q3LWE9_BIGNA|nr:Translation elongation initiation factor 4C [Bigelowiella natans]ABA27216.1 Translation elongation initiation factor 4C [Bigelowiella natans]